MARSENQGLQIAVIIFAFLTIGLSVFTFYFFNESQKENENYVAMQKERDDAKAAQTTILDERNALVEKIGLDRNANLADIQAKAAEAIQRVANTIRPQDAQAAQNMDTFIAAVDGLITTLEQLKSQVRAEDTKLQKLESDIKTKHQEYTTSVQTTTATFEKQKDDFLNQIGTLDASDKKQLGEIKKLIGSLDSKQRELDDKIAQKEKDLNLLRDEKRKAEAMAAEAIKMQYERENYVFERPDGRIVAVNAKDDVVWIDVGRADELRPGIQFTVFKRGEDNVHKRQPKAIIKVTRFSGQNMAEARIVKSELKDPILAGDVIYTPTWTPGEPERFVLAGNFYLNKDKEADNDMVLTLIRMSGGETEQELSIHTRYLLLGESPQDKQAAQAYADLRTKALDLNIKIMTFSEFLDYTGLRELLRRSTGLTALTRDEADILSVLGNRDEARKEGFKFRSAPEGARRLEPGAKPRGPRKGEPPRRPGPETGGAGRPTGSTRPGGAYRN